MRFSDETKKDILRLNPEKMASMLAFLYEEDKDWKRYLEIKLAGLEPDQTKLIKLIRKELSSLKRLRKYLHYQEEVKQLAQRLIMLVDTIEQELAPTSPNTAFELLLAVLDLHEATIRRIGNYDENICRIFAQMLLILSQIAPNIKKPLAKWVDFVLQRFLQDKHGLYEPIIPLFHNILKEEGLDWLEDKLKDGIERDKSYKKYKTVSGLQIIADCKNDTEAFIEACSILGQPLSDHDHLAIAARYIDNKEGEKALQWLDSLNSEITHIDDDRRTLQIKAFEIAGMPEKALAAQIDWFNETLDPGLYTIISKSADASFKQKFEQQAFKQAQNHAHTPTALFFLTEIGELEQAANMLYERSDSLSFDPQLASVAKVLEEPYPLAATLIYRYFILAILDHGVAKYYGSAVQDLIMCGRLSPCIDDWRTFEDHIDFEKRLWSLHYRKKRFWTDYAKANLSTKSLEKLD